MLAPPGKANRGGGSLHVKDSTALLDFFFFLFRTSGHAAYHQTIQTEWTQCLGPTRVALRLCRSLLLHTVSKLCKAGPC